MRRVIMVKSNDLDVQTRGIHLTTGSYMTLGQRIAVAMDEVSRQP
jgi:hypothetical protein